ncbi:UPF0481 protein-like [Iris pallida]|uniref:UPF0481 protein-like n=1 Tax=Iris pallida TaxID=29817 RepID=A0AAX6H952_IRIPA|nr:UPF0481 protein-like [Iris pallida]
MGRIVARMTPKEARMLRMKMLSPEEEEETPEESSADDDEPFWIGSVRKQMNSAAPKPYPRGRWTIFRVPEHIRSRERGAYDPLVVSIGPYYRGILPVYLKTTSGNVFATSSLATGAGSERARSWIDAYRS